MATREELRATINRKKVHLQQVKSKAVTEADKEMVKTIKNEIKKLEKEYEEATEE